MRQFHCKPNGQGNVNLAIIPARGGSKGIPGKNLQLVGGVPLVVRAIRACRGATGIDEVVVSSDSEQILAIAAEAGARTLFRPAEISGDQATSESVILHALEHFPGAQQVVMVQCTSPFIQASDVEGTLQLLSHGYDCAFTATPTHGFLWQQSAKGALGINHDAATRVRRQDQASQYLETGAVYAMKAQEFRRTRHRFFGKVGMHVMPEKRAIEIDEPWQLEHARRVAPYVNAPDCERLANVRLVVLDFDGVLTDNAVWTDETGREMIRASRADGMGIERLRAHGIAVEVLSKERNPVVAARCKKMGIPYRQAVEDKGPAIERLAQDHGIGLESVLYVGNDINDAPCLERVGMPVVVLDAAPEVVHLATWVLTRAGGHGAVREVCEALISCVPSKAS